MAVTAAGDQGAAPLTKELAAGCRDASRAFAGDFPSASVFLVDTRRTLEGAHADAVDLAAARHRFDTDLAWLPPQARLLDRRQRTRMTQGSRDTYGRDEGVDAFHKGRRSLSYTAVRPFTG